MKNNIRFIRMDRRDVLNDERLKDLQGTVIFRVNDVIFNEALYNKRDDKAETYTIKATVYEKTKKLQKHSGKHFSFGLWIGAQKNDISQFLFDFAEDAKIIKKESDNSGCRIHWNELKGFVIKADFVYDVATENKKTGVVYKQAVHSIKINRDTLKLPDESEINIEEPNLEI